jgi:hypothetical protein
VLQVPLVFKVTPALKAFRVSKAFKEPRGLKVLMVL